MPASINRHRALRWPKPVKWPADLPKNNKNGDKILVQTFKKYRSKSSPRASQIIQNRVPEATWSDFGAKISFGILLGALLATFP